MNEGKWIVVHNSNTGLKAAVHLDFVVSVRENSREDAWHGRRATIDFADGTSLVTCEDFEEIGEMIR